MLLFLISPSKTMQISDLKEKTPDVTLLETGYEKLLREKLCRLDAASLSKLYKASDKVVAAASILNSEVRTKESIKLFEGAVFKQLSYESLDKKGMAYLDENLLILSALYGAVTPKQKISPYRLDLNNSLAGEIENTNEIWRDKLTHYLVETQQTIIVNLASNEYKKLLDIKTIKKHKPYFEIAFKEAKQGKYVTVGTYAKMARGQFLRTCAQKSVKNIEDLKRIEVMGYTYNEKLSKGDLLVYIKE